MSWSDHVDLPSYGFPREVPPQARAGVLGLAAAVQLVKDVITDVRTATTEQAQRRDRLVRLSQAGDPVAVSLMKKLLGALAELYGVEVPGMDPGDFAERTYATVFGLDVLEELYHDPTVDEIQVNAPDRVFVIRRGVNEPTGVTFQGDEHVRALIDRLLLHDGTAIHRGQMVVESTRRDGARITAAIPPVAAHPSVVLRKHNTFQPTRENYLRSGTLNEAISDLLAELVGGRANIMISGPTASGKTALLRFLVGCLDPRLRIVSLETDRELALAQHYPARNIDEMEEHADFGCSLKALFKTALRRSPDVIIFGEARGSEAEELLKAATRGHDGTMGTVHQSSPEDAVTGVALMVLDDGKNLPLELLRLEVARAFNVIVQLYGDKARGIKRVERITELHVENDRVEFRDLCVWRPSPSDYAQGTWEFPNRISERLAAKLHKYRGVNRHDRAG